MVYAHRQSEKCANLFCWESSVSKVVYAPYKEDVAIRRMRIRAWYQAVVEASALGSRELERLFCEDPLSAANRSCIWEKYRRGEILPRSGNRTGGRPNVVERVERRYPGTARWLAMPLWRLADHAPMGMHELRAFYNSLQKPIRDIFIAPDVLPSDVFWRRGVSFLDSCLILKRFENLEGFSAVLAIIKEMEVRQFPQTYDDCCEIALSYVERVLYKKAHAETAVALMTYLERRFQKTRTNIYFESDFYELPEDEDDLMDQD